MVWASKISSAATSVDSDSVSAWTNVWWRRASSRIMMADTKTVRLSVPSTCHSVAAQCLFDNISLGTGTRSDLLENLWQKIYIPHWKSGFITKVINKEMNLRDFDVVYYNINSIQMYILCRFDIWRVTVLFSYDAYFSFSRSLLINSYTLGISGFFFIHKYMRLTRDTTCLSGPYVNLSLIN